MSTLKLTKKYSTYPEYRDSGVEWIGEIPENWRTIRAKNLFKKMNRLPDQNDDIVTAFRDGTVTLRKNRREDGFTMADKEIGYQKIKKGDLIIHGMDAFAWAIGVSDSEGKASPVYSACVPIRGSVPFFHSYLLRHMSKSKYIFALAKGIRERSTEFRFKEFWNLVVAEPSSEDQQKIANYLDEKTAMIDQIIEKKLRQLELWKEKILNRAMSEQMNGQGEFMRIKYLVERFEEYVDIKDHIQYEALGLYNRGRGIFHKELELGKDIKDSSFSYVSRKDLILSWQFAWEGAVALANENESGCVVSHRYHIIKDGLIRNEYLLALLMTKFGDFILNESSRGSAGRNRPLNIKLLLEEKIRIPSKQVQQEIADLIHSKKTFENKIKESINLLQEFKSSLISHVVTGKIKI